MYTYIAFYIIPQYVIYTYFKYEYIHTYALRSSARFAGAMVDRILLQDYMTG